jgi:hypothetical protein
MTEKGSGKIVWFVPNRIIDEKIPEAILMDNSEIKFDCPGYSVHLGKRRNGRWGGTVNPNGGGTPFEVSCNLYRQDNGVALVGIYRTDWIENGEEWQWVAELTISKDEQKGAH